MKRLFTAVLLLVGFLSQAQTDTIYMSPEQVEAINRKLDVADSLLKDTSGLTALKVYEDAKAGIIGLAKALKQPAEHVYRVLVKQQIVNSIMWFFILGIGMLFLHFFYRGARNKAEKWSDYDDPTGMGILRIFQGIIGFVLFLCGICNSDVIIGGILNPEYGAIKDIFDFVKGS